MSEEKKEIASMGKVERVVFNATNNQQQSDDDENLSAEEQANIANGLNKDGSAKTIELSEEKKKENLAAGLNEDGSAKTIELTEEKKKENLAAGLNEDGSAKTIELTEEKKKENLAAGLNEDGSAKAPVVDEAAVLNFLNSIGKKVTSLDQINIPGQEPSAEEKLKAEQALEKRMLDFFVENGGTVDQYAMMKQVASADLTVLSEKELEAELTAAGFDEDQKKMIRQERYYQLDEEEIATLTDEKEKALAVKKKEFGTKKLNSKAAHKKSLAVSFFDNLKKAIDAQDADAKQEVELAKKVDSHFEKLPRKLTLQLGKTTENVDIDPVDLDVDDAIIAQVRETLKTPAQRNKILYNEDGSLNIAALSEILVRNKVLESALNKSYLTGVSRNTAEFEKTFPIRDANALGTGSLAGGGNLGKTKGKIASFGKTVKAQTTASAK